MNIASILGSVGFANSLGDAEEALRFCTELAEFAPLSLRHSKAVINSDLAVAERLLVAATDGAASHSAEAVRHRIKTMIDGEGLGGDVLSDDRIVEILKESGIDIARRTVAKYREGMNIPSSVQRRREKMALRSAAN